MNRGAVDRGLVRVDLQRRNGTADAGRSARTMAVAAAMAAGSAVADVDAAALAPGVLDDPELLPLVPVPLGSEHPVRMRPLPAANMTRRETVIECSLGGGEEVSAVSV